MTNIDAAKDELIERIYWLIRLRWIAVAGVILVVFSAKHIFNLPILTPPLYIITALLGLYNLFFFIYLNRATNKPFTGISCAINIVANAQISLDLLSLTGLLHFSGSIENPFIFYFIFHMIIASILLSRRAAILQASFAIFLFCSLIALEYFGILRHYYLGKFSLADQHKNIIYISGISFVFVSTLYIAVYLATSIAKKLREREKSLKEANASLGEKDRIKSEYVLRVSHDIKEHLSAIQSCIQPVTGGITGSLNAKQMNLLQRADERTGKLMAFVKALLEITRIKLSREIETDYFSLKEVIENAINFVETKAQNKGILIISSVATNMDSIKGAEVYIEETIANLLANAVKYTPPGGRVDIIAVEHSNDAVRIQIKDTGIGIPKDELPRIFEEFYRASNAKEIERDGTGLGLSIAKQVVQRHKGEIWLESDEGKGTTVNITLPKG